MHVFHIVFLVDMIIPYPLHWTGANIFLGWNHTIFWFCYLLLCAVSNAEILYISMPKSRKLLGALKFCTMPILTFHDFDEDFLSIRHILLWFIRGNKSGCIETVYHVIFPWVLLEIRVRNVHERFVRRGFFLLCDMFREVRRSVLRPMVGDHLLPDN